MGAWTARWTMPLEPLPDDAEDLELLEDDVEVAEASGGWTRGRTSQRDRPSHPSSSAEGGGSTEREASTLERPPRANSA